MKRIRSALISNVVGFFSLLLCLYGYQFIHPYFESSSTKLSHLSVNINREELKNKLKTLPIEKLQEMLKAGKEVLEWTDCLKKTKSHIIQEISKQKELFWRVDFRSIKGAFDEKSYAQYYYHSHRNNGEHGHFHLFLRRGGMPPQVAPLFYDQRNCTLNDIDTYAHIIAISMDHEGQPIGLFTTNKWVTGEDWYSCLLYTSPSPRD